MRTKQTQGSRFSGSAADPTLSYVELSEALYKALGADPDGDGDEDYPYILDIMPATSTFIYNLDDKYFEQAYTLSGSTAQLVGTPTEVERNVSYQPVKMSGEFELAAQFSEGSDTVIFTGKVFEAGRYPYQRIEMTCDDIARACRAFRPVPIKDTHDEDESVFSGSLGTWTRAAVSGTDVVATLEMPAPVVALFGKGWMPKVSVEILRATKQFSAIALVKHPQVSSAQIRAAFAAFAGARHSTVDMEHIQAVHDHAQALGATCPAEMGARHNAADTADIQKMHDLAVQQGASCPAAEPPAAQSSGTDQAPAKSEKAKEGRMSFIAKARAFFAGHPDSRDKAGITEADLTDASGTNQAAPAVIQDPALAVRLAEFDARQKASDEHIAAFHAEALETRADRFATDVIVNQRKADPAERESLKGIFKMAAKADGNGAAKFGLDGTLVEGPNMKMVLESIAKRPSRAYLFENAIPDREVADDTGEQGKAHLANLRYLHQGTFDEINGRRAR